MGTASSVCLHQAHRETAEAQVERNAALLALRILVQGRGAEVRRQRRHCRYTLQRLVVRMGHRKASGQERLRDFTSLDDVCTQPSDQAPSCYARLWLPAESPQVLYLRDWRPSPDTDSNTSCCGVSATGRIHSQSRSGEGLLTQAGLPAVDMAKDSHIDVQALLDRHGSVGIRAKSPVAP